MGVDWEKFIEDLPTIMNNAGNQADEILAGKIAKVTRMTEEEVKEFFIETSDVLKVAELLTIVKSETEQIDKINKIFSNAEEFGKIFLTLLERVVMVK